MQYTKLFIGILYKGGQPKLLENVAHEILKQDGKVPSFMTVKLRW